MNDFEKKMDKGTNLVAKYYDGISKEYSRQYEVEDLLTKDKYPQNYFRLKLLMQRLKTLGLNNLYEVGCGEGTPLAVIGKSGISVSGCDISEKMVDITKEHIAEVSLDSNKVQLGDIQNFSTISNQLDAGPFDSVVAFGVMPHVVDDDLVFSNIKKLLDNKGRIFIEFRNKLFSLFTFNRYTKEFILDDLIKNVSNDVKDKVSLELDKRLNLDHPKRRSGPTDSGISYDDIRAKYHNPFEVVDFVKKHGFHDINIHWYHYHPAPPMLENNFKKDFWQEASKMEMGNNDWRGYFLCSAFVVEAAI
jgi:2-polyprenyl-3-methyl-5-hydroxy-6-metoxy-1,4-benzoquinol methylase